MVITETYVGNRSPVDSPGSFITIRNFKVQVRLMIFPIQVYLILLWLLSNIHCSTVQCVYTNMY
jgi:hypothetical protein